MTTDNVDGSLDTTGIYGVADEYPYTVECPVCHGERVAYATRFSPVKSTCRECDGLGEVAAP